MTDAEQPMTFEDYEANAQRAINDFEVDEGLELHVTRHGAGTKGDDFLELTGRSRRGNEVHVFSYRASRADLERHGDTWFTRRALRSLNDLYRAGHLPVRGGQEAEFQYLKPQDEYER